MNAIQKSRRRYQRTIETSKRVRWDIEKDVIRGAVSTPHINFFRTVFRMSMRLQPYRPAKSGS